MNDNQPQFDLNALPEILVPERHPMIYQAMPEFDFANPPVDPIEFAHLLAQTAIRHNALGVSANQFGMAVRAFAILANPIIVCYNPKVVDKSEEMIELEEGCLSFRNMILKIKRPRVIKVRYTEPNGNIVTRQFQDMTARIFQHELDHLDGIPFTKHVSTLKLDQARNEKKRLDRLETLQRSVKPQLQV